MAHSRGSALRGRTRRPTDWGLGPEQDGLIAIAANATVLWSAGVVPVATVFTIMRIRGYVSVWLEASAGIGDGFAFAHGIYMMDSDSFAVGVTAALDPIGDADSDQWIWHSFGDVRTITATIADGVNAGSVYNRIEIDSKAMRKGFDSERVLVGVTQFVETGTATVEMHADSRVLVKT